MCRLFDGRNDVCAADRTFNQVLHVVQQSLLVTAFCFVDATRNLTPLVGVNHLARSHGDPLVRLGRDPEPGVFKIVRVQL